MKKTVKMISYVVLVLGMLFMGMPTKAQQQEWKSTSTMQGISTYDPQVTEAGAMDVSPMATTTDSYSSVNAPGGPRKVLPGGPTEPGQSSDSPIGDAALPLLLFAAAFAATVAIRNRRRQVAE